MNDVLSKKGKKVSHNERITDHYRRFINPIDLLNDLKKNFNFEVIYCKSSTKFAIFNKQRPNVCRLILKKN